MNKVQIKKIDKEEKERLGPIYDRVFSGEKVDIPDIFKYKKTVELLQNDLIVLPSFDTHRILLSVPFHSTILVEVCPSCACVSHPDLIIPFLETGFIIPVLYGHYSEYSSKFVSELVKFPHISVLEFRCFRNFNLLSKSEGILCSHCIKKYVSRCKGLVSKKNRAEIADLETGAIFSNLQPFLSPDYRLLDQVTETLRSGDDHSLHQLTSLSFAIRNLRTAQAYNSVFSVPVDMLEQVERLVSLDESMISTVSLEEAREIVMQGLGLTIPEGIAISKYLETVIPYREEIKTLTDELVAEGSSAKDKVALTSLMDTVATVNHQIRRAQASTKGKMLNLTFGFLEANESLIACFLIAAALGLAGNTLGCGISMAAGVGTKFMGEKGKIKIGGVKEMRKLLLCSLEPSIQKLVSRYLGVDLKIIQIWRLREEIYHTR